MYNPFRRHRPEGRWSLAHPLREPLRAVGQSIVLWPPAAFIAMMVASPKFGGEKSTLALLPLQITVLYPLIVVAAIGAWFLLERVGRNDISAWPLLTPLLVVAMWAVGLIYFVICYVGVLLES